MGATWFVTTFQTVAYVAYAPYFWLVATQHRSAKPRKDPRRRQDPKSALKHQQKPLVLFWQHAQAVPHIV